MLFFYFEPFPKEIKIFLLKKKLSWSSGWKYSFVSAGKINCDTLWILIIADTATLQMSHTSDTRHRSRSQSRHLATTDTGGYSHHTVINRAVTVRFKGNNSRVIIINFDKTQQWACFVLFRIRTAQFLSFLQWSKYLG